MLAPTQVWAFSCCMDTGVWRYLQIGIVSNDNYLLDPVVSIVCNSAGKLFCLLHNRNNIGKMRVKYAVHIPQIKHIEGYSRDYDSYDDYNKYVEESRLDAFEGDESNYWNID